MQKLKIKKNDKVIVISGRDKGKTGTVIGVLRSKRRVLVSGVSLVRRHLKAVEGRAAGIFSKESWVDVSNVALFCTESSKPTRVGYKTDIDNKKVRFSRRSGVVIGDKVRNEKI